jgi:Flp pilus assembly protein TadD
MFCEDCGNQIKPGSAFCSGCGARVTAEESPLAAAAAASAGSASVPTYRAEQQPTAPSVPDVPAANRRTSAGDQPSGRGGNGGGGARTAPARAATGGVENYYRVLNISPTASPDDIRKAIIKELRLWSNRTNAPQIERRQEAERMVQVLEEAEGILLDAAKKAEYDRNLRNVPEPTRQVQDDDLSPSADLVAEGWRLLIAGQVADALYVATRATQVQGNNPEAWALLGQAKFRWGDTDDAIYEYKRAIQLKPNEASYYFDLGGVYESVERYKEAVEHFEKAVRIAPAEPMYRAAIGMVLVKVERYHEAIELLERCASEDPDNKSYQEFLAVAYHDGMIESWWKTPEGNYLCCSKAQADQAREIIRKAKALNFDNEELRAVILKSERMVEDLYVRKFKGSWAFVVLFGLVYIVPGVLWWLVNRRPDYKINRDIKQIVEEGKKDVLVGGEVGAYFSALPPGFKWIAYSAPRWGVWIAIICLSPFTFCYLAYDNYLAE